MRKERLEGTRPATNEEEFEAKKIEWGVGSGADRGALSVVGVFEQSKVPFKQALDPFAMILSHKVEKERRIGGGLLIEFSCARAQILFLTYEERGIKKPHTVEPDSHLIGERRHRI